MGALGAGGAVDGAGRGAVRGSVRKYCATRRLAIRANGRNVPRSTRYRRHLRGHGLVKIRSRAGDGAKRARSHHASRSRRAVQSERTLCSHAARRPQLRTPSERTRTRATRTRGIALPHGPRALRAHHDTPAQLRGVVATACAVAVAARCAERRRSLAAAGSSSGDSNRTAWACQPRLRRATAGPTRQRGARDAPTRDTRNRHHVLGRSAAPARDALWQRGGETVPSERWRVPLHSLFVVDNTLRRAPVSRRRGEGTASSRLLIWFRRARLAVTDRRRPSRTRREIGRQRRVEAAEAG